MHKVEMLSQPTIKSYRFNSNINFCSGIYRNFGFLKNSQKPTSQNVTLFKNAESLLNNAKILLKIKTAQTTVKIMHAEAKQLARTVNKLADQVQSKAATIREEVLDSYYGTTEEDIQIIRMVRSDGSTVVEEYDSDENLSRKSTFQEGNLRSIEETTKTGINRYEFNDDESLEEYYESYKKTEDGTVRASKYIGFDCGEIFEYFENVEEHQDNSAKYSRILSFEEGVVSEYIKNVAINIFGSKSSEKALDCKNGEISTYTESLREYADGKVEADAVFLFKGSRAEKYINNFQADSDDEIMQGIIYSPSGARIETISNLNKGNLDIKDF